MVLDYNLDNCVLIHYRGGSYGNFIFHIISNFISSTVKVKNQNFKFGSTGNSHKTVKYVTSYCLANQLTKKLKKYSDYKYVPLVTDQHVLQQIHLGKKFLVLCDTSIVDNYQYLLSMWPNSIMIRLYMPNFLDRLVGYANMLQKAETETGLVCTYKNSLFDNKTIEDFRQQGGDLDQHIVEAMVTLFKQNFNLYGKTFSNQADDPRALNFDIGCLVIWEKFIENLRRVAEFLQGNIINENELQSLWNEFINNQVNLKYYNLTKHTVPDQDDLIGRALVKFYQL